MKDKLKIIKDKEEVLLLKIMEIFMIVNGVKTERMGSATYYLQMETCIKANSEMIKEKGLELFILKKPNNYILGIGPIIYELVMDF